MSRCIVSCCYAEGRDDRYAEYADRLEASLDIHAPGIPRLIWRDEWPPDSPSHTEHNYAFKWFAVEAARQQGHTQVLWLDAGCCAHADLAPLWASMDAHGYALVAGDGALGAWVSDRVLEYFQTDREHAMAMSLAAGCCVGLDFTQPIARRFFSWWGELAKTTTFFAGANLRPTENQGVMRSLLTSDADGSIISLDPRVEGHRADEACFSLMMDQLGMTPLDYIDDWLPIMRTY